MIPFVEQLEPRCCPSVLPTPPESEFLALLNVARSNPTAYGASIGFDLSGVAPSPPLRLDTRLTEAARLHSEDMRDRNFFAHWNPDGLGPRDQEIGAGYIPYTWEQSIAAGYPTPAATLAALIIDEGLSPPTHRLHLLAMDALGRAQIDVGVGYAAGGSYGTWWTIDTGATDQPQPVASLEYVGGLYRDLLGRPGAASEVAGWAGLPIEVVAQGFANSPERARLVARQFVQGLYGSILHRVGEPTGVEAWTTMLVHGLPRTAAVEGFAGGPEYLGSHPNLVPALYRDVLHRTGSPAEVASWAGVPIAEVVAGFAGGPERRHIEDGEYVARLYTDVLHRVGSAAEIASWVELGLSPAVVAAAFATSPEYQE